MITDIHGKPIDPKSKWYGIRQEFRNWLQTDADFDDKRFPYEVRSGHSDVARENMRRARLRALDMSSEEKKQRNATIVEERAQGLSLKEIGYRHGLNPSWVYQIVKAAK